MAVKPEHYRPQSKRPRKITRDWLLKAVTKAVTSQDVIDTLQELRRNDPKAFLQYIDSILPKETRIESGISVKLILHGLEQQARLVEGQIVEPKALQEPDN